MKVTIGKDEIIQNMLYFLSRTAFRTFDDDICTLDKVLTKPILQSLSLHNLELLIHSLGGYKKVLNLNDEYEKILVSN